MAAQRTLNEKHQVKSYPTPLPADLIFYEFIESALPPRRSFTYGATWASLHKNSTDHPDHVLVLVTPADELGREKWYYAANRANQDQYNFVMNGEELVRTYIIPRAKYFSRPVGYVGAVADEFLYPPAGAASPDDVFTPYCFADDTLIRGEPALDSIFVVIQRRYVEPITIEWEYNETLYRKIRITKEIVPNTTTEPPDSIPGSIATLRKGNLFHNIIITQDYVLEGSEVFPIQLPTLPGIYNKGFPPRLESVDLNWAWASAANASALPSYSEQYFFKFVVTEPRPGPYAATIARYVTDDPASVAAAHPITIVPQPVKESVGVASTWASAGAKGNATEAVCREFDVPASLHEEITVNIGGVASPLSTAVYTESLAATPGVTAFFALTSAIVDHPVADAPLGLYIVSVVSVDIDNLYDDPMGVYVPLDTPANLAATAVSDVEMALNWDDVTGATSYQIFRSLTGAHFALVGTSATSNYSETGLTASTLYYYRVRALGTDVASAYSAIVSGTTDPP